MIALSDAALYPFWEAAVLLAAARAAALCGWRRETKTSAEEYFAGVLAADIAVSALLASAICFARVNGLPAYLTSAALLAAFGWRREVLRELAGRFRELALWRSPWTAAVLAAAAVPVVLTSFRPVDEVDSLNYLHFLLEWRANRLTPYSFSTNYVPFHELGFMPALVLSRRDWFLPLVELKAVLLLGLGVYLVAGAVGLPRRIAVWTTACAMLLQHLWGCHSGVGTLKPEALHAGGCVLLVLLVIRAAQRDLRPGWPALTAFAVSFATVKHTGVLFAPLCLAAMALLRVPLWRAAPGLLLVLAATGHYYLRNIWLYHNPFYPFGVRLAGIRLPGTAYLHGTSLLSNAGNPELWRLFLFPRHGLSPGGLLFPVVIVAAIAAALWGSIRLLRDRSAPRWLAFLVLTGWVLYATTFYGAGPLPGSLGYIENDLSTLRYVEGTLALSEVFLVWLLWKHGISERLLLGLVAVQGASRLWLLASTPQVTLFPLAAVLATSALLALGVRLRPAPAATMGLTALVCVSPFFVERNRAVWLPWWKDLWGTVRALPASSIFLLEDPRAGFLAAQMPLQGQRLEHDVRGGGIDLLETTLPHYAVRAIYPGEPKTELGAFAAGVRRLGYEPLISVEHGMLLERLEHISWEGRETPAWYLPERGQAPAGAVIFTVPGRLTYGGRVLDPRDGSSIRLLNCGPPGGLVYRYSADRWQSDAPPWSLPAELDVSVSEGAYKVEKLRDGDGPFLRIRAANDARWLTLVGRFPAELADRMPYTVHALTNCGACGFWLVTAAPEEHSGGTVTLLRRAQNPNPRDYFAVGLKDPRSGDYFDVREFGVRPGWYP